MIESKTPRVKPEGANTDQHDPNMSDYWEEARDAIIKLIPFYDPHHKCGIVREDIFHSVCKELKERAKVANKKAARMDALSSAGMKKILQLETELAEATQQRDKMEKWIREAAPVMSTACCIVIEDSIHRLSEIEGCRGILELCPIDFTKETE